MKRKHILVHAMIIVVILIPLIFNPLIASANMGPIYVSDSGSIISAEDAIGVYMRSESVEFNFSHRYIRHAFVWSYGVGVQANYWLKNENDYDVTIEVGLPFKYYPNTYIPDDVVIKRMYSEVSYAWRDVTLTYNYTNFTYRCAIINVTIPMNNTILVSAHYNDTLDLSHYGNFEYEYISITGQYWNHSIDHASFHFIFNDGICDKKPYSPHFDMQYHDYGDTCKANVIFKNWTPDHNIEIQFTPQQSPIVEYNISSPVLEVGERLDINLGDSYSWIFNLNTFCVDFGDGTYVNWTPAPMFNHTYDAPGSYTVIVGVMDSNGIASFEEIDLAVISNQPSGSTNITIGRTSEMSLPSFIVILLSTALLSAGVAFMVFRWNLQRIGTNQIVDKKKDNGQ